MCRAAGVRNFMSMDEEGNVYKSANEGENIVSRKIS
jgi:hypothetical protein